jgi:hypothetical protein
VKDAAGTRLLALAGVSLVALLAVLAIGRQVDQTSGHPGVILPGGGGWQVAAAAPLGDGVVPAGCGLRVAPDTLAVSHPVLPCGIRVVLDVDGVNASVQVAGRAAAPGGAAFGLTPALARSLRVGQPRLLRWALGVG